MILSAGLSPAWQQILVFDRFRVGEVNRAREAVWCSSGKVVNAGIAAHHLGGPSLTLATAGGPPRESMDRELRKLGVPLRWIATQSATRVCTTIVDRSGGTLTELVENGRPISVEEIKSFRAAFAEEAARADVVVLIGSLPAGVPTSLYREVLEKASCPAVLDFRGQGLLSVLDLRPYVVKPNREELAQTVGHDLPDDSSLREAMREINRRGAQWVIVTDGPRPVWLSSSTRAYRLHPPAIEDVVNPIGSGDALAAGVAWATRRGRPIVEAVQLGVAASGENLRQLLPCRLDPARVEQSAGKVAVEPL